MAVIKAMGGSKTRGSCSERLNYITKEEKTEEKLIFTKDCSEESFQKDFQETKDLWDKTEGRQYYHLVQSFEKEKSVNLEKAYEIGKKFIEENPKFKEYQVVMATHKDREHIHNHFIINSVSQETGKKFEFNPKDCLQAKELSNQICKEFGLKEIDLEKKQEKSIDNSKTKRYSLAEKNMEERSQDTWKGNLRDKLEESLIKSKDFEEFKKNLEQENIRISRGAEQGKKSITFEIDKNKCRGNKLDIRFESRENIEKTIDITRNLINSNKLEKERILEELRESIRQDQIKELLKDLNKAKGEENLNPIKEFKELLNPIKSEEKEKNQENEKQKITNIRLTRDDDFER